MKVMKELKLANKPLVSIPIPVYEMKGKGVQYLNVLMDSIHHQNYNNVEVVISDHSKNDDIHNILYSRKNEWNIPIIKYVKFARHIGNGPANTNNALKYCKGKYIKPMFQDDFFINHGALSIMVQMLESTGFNWLVTGCQHSKEDGSFFPTDDENYIHRPNWNLCSGCKIFTISGYLESNSWLGAPSCILYKNDPMLKFDENVVMLMDVDIYFQLAKMYSSPLLVYENYISVRIWDGNISNTKGKDVDFDKEKAYLIEKYDKQ